MPKAKRKTTESRPSSRGKSTTKPVTKKTFPDDPPDPVYAALRELTDARAAHSLAVDRDPEFDGTEDKYTAKELRKRKRDLSAAEDRVEEAVRVLARTQPTTISGIAETLAAFREDWEQNNSWSSNVEKPLFATLEKSLRIIAGKVITLAVRGG